VVIGGSMILALLNRAMQPPLLLLAHSWYSRRKRGESDPPAEDPPGEDPPGALAD
jgi:hypothetical protein